MATVEAAAVSFVGAALQRGQAGTLDLGADAETVLTAAQCQDEQHYHALLAAGGQPASNAFTIAEDMLADRTYLLVTLLELKAIGIAGYMALSREWAEAGELEQVEIGYQMGVVEGQHLSLTHALVGVTPANDRAFARWLFADASEALDALVVLGLLEGPGDTIAFPGPVDRYCRGVFGLTPETAVWHTETGGTNQWAAAAAAVIVVDAVRAARAATAFATLLALSATTMTRAAF
jgi:hypothetical protein